MIPQKHMIKTQPIIENSWFKRLLDSSLAFLFAFRAWLIMSSMSSGEFQVTFAVNDLLVLPNVVLQGTWVQNLEVEFAA